MEHESLAYVLGAAAAVFVGLSKTGIPGLGIPAVLLMAEAYAQNAKLSVGALLPILLCGDLFALAYYRRHAQWNKLLKLFPYVLGGMVPGAIFLAWIEGNQLRPVLGALVLGLLAADLARRRWGPKLAGDGSGWFTAGSGLLAGFGTTVGNAAGPVMSIYLVSRGLPKEQFIGTFAWFFFLVNAAKVPLYVGLGMITPGTLQFDLFVVPAVAVGALLGVMVLRRIPQKVFDVLVLSLAALAALRLMLG
jgi:hypothetical protein